MPPDSRKAVTATQRFGFGAAPGELPAAAADPRGHLLRQLEPVTESWDDQPGIEAAIALFAARRRAVSLQQRALAAQMGGQMGAQAGGQMASQIAPQMAPGGDAMAGPAPAAAPLPATGLMQPDLEARLQRVMTTDRPFRERLALHWMNHFTVSGGPAQFFGGAMEREALRPHMLGRFEDLLVAAALHPAMLIYLDNRNSFGPNSRAARGRRGLNENLGREILELHALGSDGGYSQDDVIALARMLSGWTFDVGAREPQPGWFKPAMHEPGPQTLLGRRYPQAGADQAVAALRDLARSPAAARHVTRRLVQHFCGSPAMAGLQPALEQVYLRTGGDLGAVTRAMVEDERAWDPTPVKVRPPVELLLGAWRMTGHRLAAPRPPAALRAMGQGFWTATAPKGWPEEDDAWAAPDAIKTRLDWAIEVSARAPAGLDARQVLDNAFGDQASAATRSAVARAASGRQALTLLLMSPEIQRR